MAKKVLRVGFDMDGVLLYNPARIARPVIAQVKSLLLKKKSLRFYYPKTPLEKYLWFMLHKTSIFKASGIGQIKELSEKKLIEPYIITARFDYLKDDFEKWLESIDAHSFFKECIHNKKDMQPHLHKEECIRRLNLDVFVEDNLDIVLHLSKKLPYVKVLWIYNILDNGYQYNLRFPDLRSSIKHIESLLESSPLRD